MHDGFCISTDIKLFCCSFSNSHFRIFHALSQWKSFTNRGVKEIHVFLYWLNMCVTFRFLYEQDIPSTKLFSYRNQKVVSFYVIYILMFWQRLISYDIRFAFDPLSCNVFFKTLDMYEKFNDYTFGF